MNGNDHPADAGAPAWRRWLTLGLCLSFVVAAFVYLVPPGSEPVGYDAWWNLHVARSWAESGFPEQLPEAGFTMHAGSFADRQIAFHGAIALLGGDALGPAIVPPMIWGLIALQGLVLLLCIRMLRPGTSPLWLLLLPALSGNWMFRATALRDMLAGVLFLLVLVTCLVRRQRGDRVPAWSLVLLAAGFGYSHGAVVLPLVLAVLVWAAGRRGAAADLQRPGWIDGLWIVTGLGIALVLRPDFPQILELTRILNVSMPWASLTGQLPVRPTEFQLLGVDELLRWELPFVVAVGLAVAGLWRHAAPRGLVVPVLFLCGASLLSRRMFEVAAPALVLLLAVQRGGRPRVSWIVAALLLVPWQVRQVEQHVEDNRVAALHDAGAWLKERARPGDNVFVLDWGLTSPLAWATRGSGLSFTGVTDPSLMWAEDRDAWNRWVAIKVCQDPDPFQTMVDRFGARFVVYSKGDTAPDRPVGETARYLQREMGEFTTGSWQVDGHTFGRWVVVELVPL